MIALGEQLVFPRLNEGSVEERHPEVAGSANRCDRRVLQGQITEFSGEGAAFPAQFSLYLFNCATVLVKEVEQHLGGSLGFPSSAFLGIVGHAETLSQGAKA